MVALFALAGCTGDTAPEPIDCVSVVGIIEYESPCDTGESLICPMCEPLACDAPAPGETGTLGCANGDAPVCAPDGECP
jgi:hypothetical protein